MTDDEVLALYERSVDDVSRYASRLTGGNRAATDELVQETYLSLIRRLRAGEQLQVDTGWLIVSCRHRFLDEMKRNQRRRLREARSIGRPMDEAAAGGFGNPGSGGGDGRATAALGRLPKDQRAALVLRYVDELAVAEVAAAIGRSVHATESLLARGRAAMRADLTPSKPAGGAR